MIDYETEPKILTHRGPLPEPRVQAAEDFVKLLGDGASLQEASEETGLAETSSAVRKALRRLGIYAKLDKELFRRVSEAALQEIVLHGEPRDVIAAYAKLYPEAQAPQVEIHLAPEIARMDVSLPGRDQGFVPEKKGPV